MTGDDITDIEDYGPDSEFREAWILTAEEQVVLDAFRSLSEPRRAALWSVLAILHRAERGEVDGGS